MKKTKVSDGAIKLLVGLRELFSTKDQWVSGRFAANSLGNVTDVTSAAACKWCALGGLAKIRVDLNLSTNDYRGAIRLLTAACINLFGKDSITATNDLLGYDAITCAIDCAIKHTTVEP